MPNPHKGNEAIFDTILCILFKQNRKHVNDIIISGAVLCCCCCGLALVNRLLIIIASGQSYMHKVAHLQVVVVVKAVWGIFNNTNRSLFTS